MNTTNHTSPGEDAANGGSWERADIEWLLKLAERSAHDGDLSIARVRAALTAEKVAAEPVAWFTDDSQSDRSATTWDRNVADRWRAKGWPVHPLYAAPQPAQTQVALTDEQVMSVSIINGEVTDYKYAGNLLDGEYPLYVVRHITEGQAASILAAALRFETEGNKPMANDMRALLAAQPVSGGKS
jgi:hypothetical protein